jgi:hypothetical protein
MKRLVGLGALAAIMCTTALAAHTYSDDPRFTDENLQVIEKNLKTALEDGNYGVQASAAQVVREVKALVPKYEFYSLVVPLLHIAKGNGSQPESSRIVATLALYDLVGDSAIEPHGIMPVQTR